MEVDGFERGAPCFSISLANDPPGLAADFRRLQIGYFHSEQFIARIAEERAGSLVDFDDVVAVVLQEYRVVGLLEKGPVALLALAQCGFARAQLVLGVPQLRDVPADAAIADEASRLIEHRDAGNGVVDPATGRGLY